MSDTRLSAPTPEPATHDDGGCSCPWHSRRLFTSLLLAGAAAPVLGQDGEGVRSEVGKTSRLAKLVPAEQVEEAAAAQYAQMQKQAAQQRSLAPANHPQVVRLRSIAERLPRASAPTC